MSVLGTVRASAWSSLMDCGYRFYCENVLGMRKPSSGAAHLGTSLHASTAAFDEGLLSGDELTVDDAASVFVDTLHSPDEEVSWDSASEIKKAEKVGLVCHTNYCLQIAPAHEYLAVELQCEALDIETEFGAIRITGTTDRVKITPGGKGIVDLKSGKRSVGADGRAVTRGHHLQLGIYTIMAEHAFGEEFADDAEIVGLSTTNGSVGTGNVQNPKLALVGDGDLPGLIEMAAMMFKTGAFYPNPRSMLCSERYCAAWSACKYRG